jgi:hypothetical protein
MEGSLPPPQRGKTRTTLGAVHPAYRMCSGANSRGSRTSRQSLNSIDLGSQFGMAHSTTLHKSRRSHRSGERGGITISRRPNKCPSTENAPGPSKAIPTATIAISKATNTAPRDTSGGAGTQGSVVLKMHRARRALASGVINPAIKPAPLTSNMAAMIQTTTGRSLRPDRYKTPNTTATAPKAARKRSRPIPGRPLGKVENSLCSETLPLAHSTTARHCGLSLAHGYAQPSMAGVLTNPFGVLSRTKHSQSWMIPRRRPMATAWVRSFAPSFSIMCLM